MNIITSQLITQIFLWGGLLLIVAELFLPGLVVIFIGAAALVVAGLRYFGFVDQLTVSLFWFFLLSIFFVLVLRQLVSHFLPGEVSRGLTDEDAVIMGTKVKVLSRVTPDNNEGRVRFAGISWSARSLTGAIEKGEQARVVLQENTCLIVEKIE